MLQDFLNLQFDSLRQRPLRQMDVAVLDSGVDASHAELACVCKESVAVDTTAGSPTVVATPANANNDLFGHGTAVASIIHAVAPNARIVDVRVLGSNNTGAGASLVEGLKWAIARRIPVVNMSLAATSKFSSQLAELCETAYRQGQIVVAARRNIPLTDDGFPAELSSVISVDRKTLPFLEIRYRLPDPIEFEAQGESVVCAAAGGGYTTKTGTSFATPAVSGMCALFLGADPTLRPFEIKALLKAQADRRKREDGIRKKAYEIWVANGCPEGRSLQNWLDAERSMFANLPPEMAENHGHD